MHCEQQDIDCTQRVASINQLNKFPGLFYIYIKYININTQAAAVEGVEYLILYKNDKFKSCERTKLRLEY